MKLRKSILACYALCMMLVVGLFGATAMTASAAQASPGKSDASASPEHRPIRLVGIVAQVGERGIVLRTHRGPVHVVATENTIIRVQGDDECVDGTLEDLQTGERAVVVGMISRNHVVVARGILQCRPDGEAID